MTYTHFYNADNIEMTAELWDRTKKEFISYLVDLYACGHEAKEWSRNDTVGVETKDGQWVLVSDLFYGSEADLKAETGMTFRQLLAKAVYIEWVSPDEILIWHARNYPLAEKTEWLPIEGAPEASNQNNEKEITMNAPTIYQLPESYNGLEYLFEGTDLDYREEITRINDATDPLHAGCTRFITTDGCIVDMPFDIHDLIVGFYQSEIEIYEA